MKDRTAQRKWKRVEETKGVYKEFHVKETVKEKSCIDKIISKELRKDSFKNAIKEREKRDD